MPKRHRARQLRRQRRHAMRNGAHWLGLAGAGLLLAGGSANANPQGGQITAGSATIGNSSPAQLDVTQSTDRAVIDWQSFNIAVGERTQFHQPAASSWTLNRVNAPNPSTIAGYLGANGSLVLVNPSGVVFTKGSQVNVNSIIATPSGISNANFMAGKMRFDQPGNPNARVENAGTITVAQKGLAALVAPSVANSGLIQAKLGKVVLAGAATYTLDFYGDGLINFDVGPKVATVPVGPDGKPVKSLVSNTGTIDAPGGTVILTADAVSGILENVIDSPGTISARTTTSPAGTVSFGDIKIDAGDGNQARLAGTLDVSAQAVGLRGGTAVVTGGSVRLTDTARINARGPAGGGNVRIGGGPHGADTTVRNAQKTVIDAGAVIDASATDNGNGGNVAVWSDGSTTFNGAIYAKGGPNGGNGGWVETSGHTLAIASSAVVDASAPAGSAGTWLLDPTDLTVTAASNNINDSGSGGATDTISPSASPATVANTTIQNALNTGNGGSGSNVILTTIGSPNSGVETGAITVNAGIGWDTPRTLTLNAAGNVSINAAISGANASSVLALSAGGSISQSVAGVITIGNLSATAAGAIDLAAANRVSGKLAAQVTGSGNAFDFNNTATALTVDTVGGLSGVTTNGGNIVLQTTTSGNITLNQPLNANNGTASTSGAGAVGLSSAGGINGANATNLIVASSLDILAANSISLFNTGGITTLVGTLGAEVTGAGQSFEFGVAGSITVDTVGAVTASGLSVPQFSGIATNGGHIVMGSSGGLNIQLNQPLNANNFVAGAPSTTLGASPGLVGLVGQGTISQSSTGIILARELDIEVVGNVTLSAANRLGANDVAGFATTAGIFNIQEYFASGNTITLRNDHAPLSIGPTMNAPALAVSPGVTGDGGVIQLSTTTAGNISVTQPINNGSGAVSLISAGAISESGSGLVNTTGLLTTSSVGGTTLTGANTIGTFNATNTISGGISLTNTASPLTLAGISESGGGNVTVNNNGALSLIGAVSTDGGGVNLTASAAISESGGGLINTTGTLTTSSVGGTTLNGANTVGSFNAINTTSGDISLINTASPLVVSGVAQSGGGSISITNTGELINAGAMSTTAGGNIALTADLMALNSAVNAGTGVVTLKPATSGRNIDLGTNPSAGNLGIAQADLNQVTAGILRIGDLSSTGNITITAPITDVGTGWNTLSLLTGIGGSISQSAGATLTVTNLNAAGATGVTLTEANSVSMLAGAANTGSTFHFVDSIPLTIGTVDPGLGSAFGVGIITGGPITLASSATGTSLTVSQALDTTHFGGTGGNVALTFDSMTLGAAINGGTTGIVQLTPITFARAVDVGTKPAGALGLTQAELNQVTAGILRIGDVSTTGNLTITAPITNPAGWNTLSLLTGVAGGITQNAGASLTVPNLLAAGATGVTLTEANVVSALAGASLGTFHFVDSIPLTVGSVDSGLGGGFGTGIITGGPITLASSAAGTSLTVNQALNTTFFGGSGADVTLTFDSMTLGAAINGGTTGIVTLQPFSAGRPIDLGTSTGAGDLVVGSTALDTEVIAGTLVVGNNTAGALTVNAALAPTNVSSSLALHSGAAIDLVATIDMTGRNVSLVAGAGISETPGVIASTLAVTAVGPVSMLDANQVGTLAANVTGAGNGFSFRNDNLTLTIGTVGAVSGVTTNNGAVMIETTTSGSIAINQPITAGTTMAAVTAAAGGSITQTAAVTATGGITLTADTMTLGAAVNGGGAVVELQPTAADRGIDLGTNPSAGNLGLAQSDLSNITAGILRIGNLTTSGNVTVTAPISAPAGWSTLSLLTDVSSGITQNAGATLTVTNLNAAGATGVTLNETNSVSTLAGASEGTFSFVNSGNLTIGQVDTGLGFGFGTGIITSGPINLTASGASVLNIQQALDTTHFGGSGANVTLSANDIALAADVNAGVGTVSLTAGDGGINQTGGIITANLLTGTSVNTVTLFDSNVVSTFGPFSVTGAFQNLRFLDSIGFTTAGTLSTGPVSNITLRTSGGNLALGGDITADSGGTVTLSSDIGTITQNSGIITTNAGLSADAAGTVSLLGANAVSGTLDGLVTGSGAFLFRNDSTDITVGLGVTTNGGRISLSTTTSGNIGTGSQSAAINSSGGEIDIAVAPGSAFTNSAKAQISSSGGNIVILADNMSLSGGLGGQTIDAGSGAVVLAPATASRNFGFGFHAGTALVLQQADIDTVTAGMLQIGYRNTNGTAAYTGNIDFGLAASINTSKVPVLALVTGGPTGTVTETGGPLTSNTGPALKLGVIAGGTVSLNNLGNSIGTLAVFTDGANSGFSLTESAPLTVSTLASGVVQNAQLGLAVSGTDGSVSSAIMGNPPPNPLSGITTTGDIALTTVGGTANGITIDTAIDAPGHNVSLASAGFITEAPPVVSSTLAITAVGPVSMLDANQVGTLAASVTGAGNSFAFRNDGLDLTIGTVGALSGVTTNLGNIILETTTSGNLVLNQQVNANNGSAILAANPGQIGLASAGSITQSGAGGNDGRIIGSSLEAVSVSSTSLPLANIVGNGTGAGTPGLVAGRVLSAGQGFGFIDANSLNVDTVDVQTSGAVRLFNPLTSTTATPVALTAGLSGVATQAAAGSNIVVETTSGPLTLNQRLDAGANFDPTTTTLAFTGAALPATPGAIGLSSADTLTQSAAGQIIGSALEVIAGNSVSLGTAANRIGANDSGGVATIAGLLAGSVANSAQSLFLLDFKASLQVDTLAVSATGLTLPNKAGIVTNNGEIALRTQNAGSIALSAPIDTSAGNTAPRNVVALQAGGAAITQTSSGPITASGLLLLGFGGATVTLNQANQVDNIAGFLSGSGTLGFNNTANDLTVNTVTSTLLGTTASGIFTNGGDVALTTTTSGKIELDQNIVAGTGLSNVALVAKGDLFETGAAIIQGNELIADASGFVALDNANIVNFLSGRAGTSFAFTNAQTLTLDHVPPVLGIPEPLGQSDVITTVGDIRIRTTAGNLTLTASGNVNAGGGGANNAALVAAGNLSETGGIVTANGLIANAGGNVGLDGGNFVNSLSGRSGTSFAFTNAQTLTLAQVATGGWRCWALGRNPTSSRRRATSASTRRPAI